MEQEPSKRPRTCDRLGHLGYPEGPDQGRGMLALGTTVLVAGSLYGQDTGVSEVLKRSPVRIPPWPPTAALTDSEDA